MNEEILIGKLNEYIIPKIKEHSNKGRPYSINNEELIEAFFYVLKYGITWKLASKLVFGNYSYRSTLNRRFNQLVSDGIITSTYNEMINNNEIGDLIIDSIDRSISKIIKMHLRLNYMNMIND